MTVVVVVDDATGAVAVAQQQLLPPGHGQTVCVTGAAGYIASWLVKLLLERGRVLNLRRRDAFLCADDPKNAHLKALDGAAERLVLCKADLLDYDSIRAAVNGCHGVFHTASPVTDDPVRSLYTFLAEYVASCILHMLTRIISMAWFRVGNIRMHDGAGADGGAGSAGHGVRDKGGGGGRHGAPGGVHVVHRRRHHGPQPRPRRGRRRVLLERPRILTLTTSGRPSFLLMSRSTDQNWYCYGKAVAEQAACEAANDRGVDLVVVNPVLVVGPLLQPTVNASAVHILKYLDGSAKKYANAVQAYVDVRDVAAAHVRVFEAPEASGRYLCAERVLHREDVVHILGKLFPEYPVPTRCSDEVNPRKQPYQMSNKKLQDLGLQFIPVSDSLYETVKSLQVKGHLPVLSKEIPEELNGVPA